MTTKRPRRRSLRLREYDYTQPGAYFITICTSQRTPLFDAARHREILEEVWAGLPTHYSHVALDAFVIMPDHMHGIIFIRDADPVGAGFKPAPTNTQALPEVVRGFKTFSARKINALRGTTGISVWQRSYYEHIIRNESDLNEIRQYIEFNPLQLEHNHQDLTKPILLKRSRL